MLVFSRPLFQPASGHLAAAVDILGSRTGVVCSTLSEKKNKALRFSLMEYWHHGGKLNCCKDPESEFGIRLTLFYQ